MKGDTEMVNHKETGKENTVANTNDELVYMWHSVPYYYGEFPQQMYEADFQQLDKDSEAVQDLFRIAAKGREGIVAEYQNREEYWDERTLAFIKGKEEVLITAHHAVDENYRDEFTLFVVTRLTKEHHEEFSNDFQQFCSKHKLYNSTVLLSKYSGEKHFKEKHAILAVGIRKEFEYNPAEQEKETIANNGKQEVFDIAKCNMELDEVRKTIENHQAWLNDVYGFTGKYDEAYYNRVENTDFNKLSEELLNDPRRADFSNVKFTVDNSQMEFNAVDLSGANFKGADFSEAPVNGFYYVGLNYADLSDAKFTAEKEPLKNKFFGCQFRHANLKGASEDVIDRLKQSGDLDSAITDKGVCKSYLVPYNSSKSLPNDYWRVEFHGVPNYANFGYNEYTNIPFTPAVPTNENRKELKDAGYNFDEKQEFLKFNEGQELRLSAGKTTRIVDVAEFSKLCCDAYLSKEKEKSKSVTNEMALAEDHKTISEKSVPAKEKKFFFKRSPKLTEKQNNFAYAIEKWAFDNNIRNKKGYLLTFNRNAENVPASFNLLVKQAQAQGFNKEKGNDLQK